MLAVRTDSPHPLAEFRRLGITAQLAWAADDDDHALVLVEPDHSNLRKLERWLASNPRLTVLPRT